MITYKLTKRRYPSGCEDWSAIYRSGKCVGRLSGSKDGTFFNWERFGDGHCTIYAKSAEDLCKKLESSGYVSKYNEYPDPGACCMRRFDPRKGIKVLADVDKCYPLVEEIIIRVK